MLTEAPKSLGVDTSPDPVGHFGPLSSHFGFCGQCVVASCESTPGVARLVFNQTFCCLKSFCTQILI